MTKRIKKKNFSSFTYIEAFKHLNLEELNLWSFEVEPLELSPFFQERLQRLTNFFDLQSYEESKKLLIDAICEEAIYDCKHLKIWKGAQLADDTTSGYVDYLIAPRKRYLESPFLCIVEAKKDDFEQGLAQCLVEMKACQANNRSIDRWLDVLGIVTNGGSWQFYRLRIDGSVDETAVYSTGNMADLLGRLRYIFHLCEQNIPRE
ncbi:MAG: hypothetical protein WBC69_12030 [Geitlerinemataceae cyanobacterium]